MFVKPKILLGSVILGLSATACVSGNTKQYTQEQTDTVKVEIETLQTDTIKKEKNNNSMSQEVVTPPIIYDDIDIFCYVKIDPENAVHDWVDKMPQFQGGERAMREFFDKNLNYPEEARETGIQGRVLCRFIIEKDGSISNVEIVRGVHPLLDKEAVRLIESMPKWIPGEHNDERVRVSYSIPIIFKLQ